VKETEKKVPHNNVRGDNLLAEIALHRAESMAATAPVRRGF
jgi:hypothetical protein